VEFSPVSTDHGWLVVFTDNKLLHVARDDGEILWKQKLSAAPSAGPVLLAGRVFVATDFPRPRLAGFDLDTGDTHWEIEVSAVHLVAGTDTLFTLENPGWLSALDPHTGDDLWSVPVIGAGPGAPILVGDVLVAPVRPDSLVAVNRSDGSRRWGIRPGWQPEIAASGSRIHASTVDSVLLAIDSRDGSVLQWADLPGRPVGPPVIRESVLYQALTDGRVVAASTATLEVLWISSQDAPLVSSPAVFGDRVAQAGPRGRVVLLRASDGVEIVRIRHPERVLASPVFHDGQLVLGGSGGTVIAYRENP